MVSVPRTSQHVVSYGRLEGAKSVLGNLLVLDDANLDAV